MGKGVALKDYVEIDGHDLSDFCSQVNPQFVDSQEDISGFNPTGVDESTPGTRAQTIALTFFDSYGDGEAWDVLYKLWKNREIFTFKTRPDQSIAVGSTNPSLEGNARIYGWSPNRTRGQVASFPVTIASADADGFDYVES